MSLAIISQDTILGHAVRLTREAQQRVLDYIAVDHAWGRQSPTRRPDS